MYAPVEDREMCVSRELPGYNPRKFISTYVGDAVR